MIDKIIGSIMGLILAGLAVLVIVLSIPEAHAGVVKTVCYIGSENCYEYLVALDGGGSVQVRSDIQHIPGDDIGVRQNYWTEWEY